MYPAAILVPLNSLQLVKIDMNEVSVGGFSPPPTVEMKGVFVDGYPPPSSVEMNGVHVNDFIPASPPTLVL